MRGEATPPVDLPLDGEEKLRVPLVPKELVLDEYDESVLLEKLRLPGEVKEPPGVVTVLPELGRVGVVLKEPELPVLGLGLLRLGLGLGLLGRVVLGLGLAGRLGAGLLGRLPVLKERLEPLDPKDEERLGLLLKPPLRPPLEKERLAAMAGSAVKTTRVNAAKRLNHRRQVLERIGIHPPRHQVLPPGSGATTALIVR